MRPFFGETLARVAKDEVHRRVAYLGKNIAAMDDETKNAAIVNFQAWSAIADWLDHGFTRLVHIYGGIDDDVFIDWKTLDEAAAKELKALDEKVEAGAGSCGEQEEAGQASEARAELLRRRDCIFCIHTAVANWRATLEDTQAEILASIAAEKAAA